MTTTIDIPKELLDAVDQTARRMRASRDEVLVEALRSFLRGLEDGPASSGADIESEEFKWASASLLERAYGDDEPDYSDAGVPIDHEE